MVNLSSNYPQADSTLNLDNNIDTLSDEQLRLTAQVAALGNLITPQERDWFTAEINKPDFDREKINFYFWAAEERNTIVQNSPSEKKSEIYELTTNILNQSSDGRRDLEKKMPLQRIKDALLKFKSVQKEVNDRTLKIKQLPAGFEKQIWQRFMERFEKETPGNIWNLDLIENFEQSVKTTFTHLAKVLEMQESIKAKLSKEKAFQLQDTNSTNTVKDSLTQVVNSRLILWSQNTDFHLKGWAEEFSNIIKKQTPLQLKEFNTHYSQVFNKSFWKIIPEMHPQEFPNFAGTFNFLEEKNFLNNFSIEDLKSFPKTLKESIINDAQEVVSDFFSPDEQRKSMDSLLRISDKKPAEILKQLKKIKQSKEKNKVEARKLIIEAKTQFIDHENSQAEQTIVKLTKKFGPQIFIDLGEQSFVNKIEFKTVELKSLKKRIKAEHDSIKRIKLQQQLDKLQLGNSKEADGKLNSEQKKEKIKDLKNLIKEQSDNQDLKGALSSAKRLARLDSKSGNPQIEKINKKIERSNQRKKPEKKEGADSADKMKQISFLEKSIEHAQEVMKACDDLGIPKSDPKYWGPEGIKNRVVYLKNHGLWEKYKKFNLADPNIPSNTQGGSGFRFRWLDNFGEKLSGNRADSGERYIQKFKEGGYHLAALAGAFSAHWIGNKETFPPDKFITVCQTKIGEVKASR